METEIKGQQCRVKVSTSYDRANDSHEMTISFEQGDTVQELDLTGRDEWADMLDAIEGFGIYKRGKYDVQHVINHEDGDSEGLFVQGGRVKPLPPVNHLTPATAYRFDVVPLMEAIEEAIAEYDYSTGCQC